MTTLPLPAERGEGWGEGPDEADEIAATPVSTVSDDEKWRRAVDAVREASPRHGRSLAYARFLGFTADGARVVFGPDATFHKSQVFGLSRALVETELSRSLGRPIKLTEEQRAAFEAAPKSIAEVEAGERNTREAQIKTKVETHPALRAIQKHLGGRLEHISFLEPAPKIINAADDSDERPPVD